MALQWVNLKCGRGVSVSVIAARVTVSVYLTAYHALCVQILGLTNTSSWAKAQSMRTCSRRNADVAGAIRLLNQALVCQ